MNWRGYIEQIISSMTDDEKESSILVLSMEAKAELDGASKIDGVTIIYDEDYERLALEAFESETMH